MPITYEFHVSRRSRDRYQFDETLLSTDGKRVATSTSPGAGFAAARRFAERVYAVSGKLVAASDIYAAALIEEILHILIRHYENRNPGVMRGALLALHTSLGSKLDETLIKFTDEFPPQLVYRGQQTVGEYLGGSTNGVAHSQVAIEEMLLVNIANRNPALEAYKEFFDDSVLQNTAYPESIRLLTDFFAHQPPLQAPGAAGGETLIEMLSSPARAAPYSLEGQLQFLLDKWGAILGPELKQMILRAMDFVREEVIRHTGAGGFLGSQPLPDFRGEPEYERYSTDTEWMPRLVLIAKNAYVWLEQLSRKHQRWIRTLDEIPDAELDLLTQRGFTGLWLIGLWERSAASQRIKQRLGQHDAVASAYSLYSYDIAAELGGWEALQNLRARSAQRGLRLSADMVPNHMGIDSRWVMEHPDWFLSLDRPPYPSYSFNSENLSDDARVGIYLEDHYYDHSDAAVVFQRRDHYTGDASYIYHGNDGTSFPWNDTAQLDYSKAQVREAVIQTILHVARNFPIIRFDAAMTLAKKHIQRLWFPEPGAGGAIPSRAEHGITRAEFDAAMPNEFWREVVDRVAAEAPETLLLAEAFWLLEGYFVRTLGMHRVYNSAFMHMLRDEDNAKYRQLIKNTLEFDPQILRRYVNFMNNPDEKTAIEQFGTSDKYFGVCTLLATLPGLPMFGHGQIEGFREKYGMEYHKPKWDETPDEALVHGHEWNIFPLLHRRSLFADVEHFFLFDFYEAGGKVNENVLAYSNRQGEDRALVIYHNSYAEARGWIKISAAALDKDSSRLVRRSLGEALGLPREGFGIFRDYVTHLEYIRSCSELWEQGFHAELGAYQHQVFMDWRFVRGPEWAAVCERLNGAGDESVQGRWAEMFRAEELGVMPAAAVREPRRRKGGTNATKKAPAKKTAARKPPAKKTATKVARSTAKTTRHVGKKHALKKSVVKKPGIQTTSSKKTRAKKSANNTAKTPAKG